MQTLDEEKLPFIPFYNIHKSYADNVKEGPLHRFQIERQWPDESKWISFLGQKIASPLGVPAGPLLTSEYVKLAALLGFDVLTYKTIRSKKYEGHPHPNVVFVQELPNGTVQASKEIPNNYEELNITNSFGMPSMPESFLQEDISCALHALKKGQVLIVSIVGTSGFSDSLKKDFVKTALLAKEAGAPIIEANFSCPNICSKEGSLYLDPDNAYQIAKSITDAVSPLPVIVKVGLFPSKRHLQKTLIALAKANVQAVAGINSVSKKVVSKNGDPFFGSERHSSGICGSIIKNSALEFVKEAFSIIQNEKLGLKIIGGGGITMPSHFDEFLAAGASIATSATAMMWDPTLAARWHGLKQSSL